MIEPTANSAGSDTTIGIAGHAASGSVDAACPATLAERGGVSCDSDSGPGLGTAP